MSVRATLMVGHPGERDGDFDALLEFVRAGGIEHAGIFQYSREEGTAAAALPESEHVPPARAAARRARLAFAQLGVVRARHRRLVGARARVVVDAVPGGDEPPRARLVSQAPDDADGVVLVRAVPPKLAARLAPGRVFAARITGYDDYDLHAELLEEVDSWL